MTPALYDESGTTNTWNSRPVYHVAPDMADFVPPLVISVHGIRTRAEWQNTLAEELARFSVKFKNRRFGYYPLRHFIRSGRNQQEVDSFFTWYSAVVAAYRPAVDPDVPAMRPSVIAHSFGSFIVCYAMLKHKEIKFDKVILCGSILPGDFDWNTLMVRDQVGQVWNECGGKDTWVAVAPWVIRDTGRSGRDGFVFIGSKCRSEFYDFHSHSDFFQPGHITETWLRRYLMAEPSTLTTIHGGDVASPSQYERYIAEVRAIDRERFNSLPGHDSVAIPEGYSRQWRGVNPDIYTFLLDRATGAARGYINAMPLKNEWFEDVLSGKVPDNRIPGEAVVPYVADQQLSLYLMSIAVADGAGRFGGLYNEALESLVDAFIGLLRRLARNNIRIREIAAIGWTPEGIRLCEDVFGMRQDGSVSVDSGPAHPVYRLQLSGASLGPRARRHRGVRKLLDAYDTLRDSGA